MTVMTSWILLWLCLAALMTHRCNGGNDVLGLDIPTEPNLDPNTVCKTYPDLTAKQYSLCSRYPDVTASAIQGIQVAIHECQRQFKTHRWNCSALERKNKNPHSSPFLARGYKETAFAYAILAAGVVTQVARACSLGKLESCGCQPVLNHATNQWQWKGCDHNVEFGNAFGRKFLDSEDRAKDFMSKVNRHNNKVGRMTVFENLRKMCKRHGMSGSCEMKTCWRAAPQFHVVGEVLKQKYLQASKVQMINTNSASGRVRLRLVYKKKRRKRPSKSSLVFYETSPNFCEDSSWLDSPGTRGRYCNKTSTDIDNCETLCCGRGYNTLKVTRVERCNCRFHWCCYVVCKKCLISDWVTVCK
uniref:Protein Wnt n=1 Tax=Platynereis dumerilii TaxID=6359 RepID=Q8MPL4_PLADU|nr:Wnt10 protein [Platynereis dumerilii]